MEFSNKQLKDMIVPLFMEQFLVLLVGIADTFMISYAGEAAVSGVSLVNSFNTIFIYIFTALASGGAVVISQYIGSGSKENSRRSASQLLMFSTIISLVLMILVLIGNRTLLSLIFGKVDADVMEACVTYLWISALSYPFIAIYNAGASTYRSMGRTRETMYISIASNIINVIGNYIGVFILHAGVAGVAWPSTFARVFSAVVMTILACSRKRDVHYEADAVFTWDGSMLKKILGIAVPNGIENGIFQAVKVMLSSMIALFGTYQIAANGVAQSIWSLAAVCSSAMGPVFFTVIGQQMGAGDIAGAEKYFKKLMKINLALSVAWNALILAATPLILMCFSLSAETKHLVWILVIIHNLFNGLALPFSGNLGNGLRAAGDVRFSMIVSISSTIGGRLLFSYILAIIFNMGVIGIAFAMCLDWCIRGVIFTLRFRSGKWKQFKVI